MGGSIWLSIWSTDVSAFNDTSSRRMYLGVYASFGVVQGKKVIACHHLSRLVPVVRCRHVLMFVCLHPMLFISLTGLIHVVSASHLASVGVRASSHMSSSILASCLRCPMSVYETTPIGRFLSRFSNDLATVDFVVPFTYRSMINGIAILIITAMVIGVNLPWFLLVALILAFPYYLFQVCMAGLYV